MTSETKDNDVIEGDILDETPALVVPSGTALQALTRGEIDGQIATAKQYPRSIQKFGKTAIAMATIDQQTAESCSYTLARSSKEGASNTFSGPSIRLAEIAACCWGNMRYSSRVIAVEETVVVAQGTCHDLETNLAVQVEARRSIMTSSKKGKKPVRYGNDMIAVTAQAACSIAMRNAILKVIPGALVKPIFQAARRTAVGDAKTLTERRDGALAWFKAKEVPPEKVFEWLGIAGPAEFTLDHLADLQGLRNAIMDGVTSVTEVFFADKPADGTKVSTGSVDDAIAKGKKPAPKKDAAPEATGKTLTPQDVAIMISTATAEYALELYDKHVGPDASTDEAGRELIGNAYKARVEALKGGAENGP